MATPDQGDEFFSDNDLDDLPYAAYQELEHHAIQATQQHRQSQVDLPAPPPPPPPPPIFQRQAVTPRAASRHQSYAHQPPSAGRRPIFPPPAASSDYGDADFDDDDLDDAVVFDQRTTSQPAFAEETVGGLATQGQEYRRETHAQPLSGGQDWQPLPQRPRASGLDDSGYDDFQNVAEYEALVDGGSFQQAASRGNDGETSEVINALHKQVAEVIASPSSQHSVHC